jgi:hypothetical protein
MTCCGIALTPGLRAIVDLVVPDQGANTAPRATARASCLAEIPMHLGLGAKATPQTRFTGEVIVKPPGVWQIADVAGTATALLITAGVGSQNRPR